MSLKDVPSNHTEAYVDDLILIKGGPPVDLTADQITRVEDTGAKLDVGATKDDGGDS